MGTDLTPEIIKSIIKEVIKEEREEFWIPQPQHYLDHEFISAIRSSASWGQKIGLGFIVTSTLTFLGWAIWQSIKSAVK